MKRNTITCIWVFFIFFTSTISAQTNSGKLPVVVINEVNHDIGGINAYIEMVVMKSQTVPFEDSDAKPDFIVDDSNIAIGFKEGFLAIDPDYLKSFEPGDIIVLHDANITLPSNTEATFLSVNDPHVLKYDGPATPGFTYDSGQQIFPSNTSINQFLNFNQVGNVFKVNSGGSFEHEVLQTSALNYSLSEYSLQSHTSLTSTIGEANNTKNQEFIDGLKNLSGLSIECTEPSSTSSFYRVSFENASPPVVIEVNDYSNSSLFETGEFLISEEDIRCGRNRVTVSDKSTIRECDFTINAEQVITIYLCGGEDLILHEISQLCNDFSEGCISVQFNSDPKIFPTSLDQVDPVNLQNDGVIKIINSDGNGDLIQEITINVFIKSVGDPCDDANECTDNDEVTDDCKCVGMNPPELTTEIIESENIQDCPPIYSLSISEGYDYYIWAKDGIEVSTEDYFHAELNGTYEVEYGYDDGACTNGFALIVLDQLNPIEVNISASSLIICDAQDELLTAEVNQNNLSYTWYRNDEYYGNDNTLGINEAGTYRIEVEDLNGCIASDEINIEDDSEELFIDPPNPVICLSENYFATETYIRCLNDGYDEYVWEQLEPLLPFQTPYQSTGQEFFTAQPGKYKLTATKGDCINTLYFDVEGIEIPINIGSPVLPNQSQNAANPIKVCSGECTLLPHDPLQSECIDNPQLYITSPKSLEGYYDELPEVCPTENTVYVYNTGGWIYKPRLGNVYVKYLTYITTIEVEEQIDDLEILVEDDDLCDLHVPLTANKEYDIYEWYFDGDFLSRSKSIIAYKSGTYSVKVFTEAGCEYETSKAIVINDPWDVGITGPNKLCAEEESYELTSNRDLLGMEVVWKDEDDQFIGTDLITSISESGFYTVTVNDQNGCTETTSIYLTREVSDPTISPASPTLCAGGIVEVSCVETYDSYQWMQDGVNLPGNSAHWNYDFTEAGEYQLKVTEGTCVAIIDFEVYDMTDEAGILSYFRDNNFFEIPIVNFDEPSLNDENQVPKKNSVIDHTRVGLTIEVTSGMVAPADVISTFLGSDFIGLNEMNEGDVHVTENINMCGLMGVTEYEAGALWAHVYLTEEPGEDYLFMSMNTFSGRSPTEEYNDELNTYDIYDGTSDIVISRGVANLSMDNAIDKDAKPSGGSVCTSFVPSPKENLVTPIGMIVNAPSISTGVSFCNDCWEAPDGVLSRFRDSGGKEWIAASIRKTSTFAGYYDYEKSIFYDDLSPPVVKGEFEPGYQLILGSDEDKTECDYTVRSLYCNGNGVPFASDGGKGIATITSLEGVLTCDVFRYSDIKINTCVDPLPADFESSYYSETNDVYFVANANGYMIFRDPISGTEDEFTYYAVTTDTEGFFVYLEWDGSCWRMTDLAVEEDPDLADLFIGFEEFYETFQVIAEHVSIHTALDALGFIPYVGIPADFLNAIIYGFEGEWTDAGISLAAIAFEGAVLARAAKRPVKCAIQSVNKAERKAEVGKALLKVGGEWLEAPIAEWRKALKEFITDDSYFGDISKQFLPDLIDNVKKGDQVFAKLLIENPDLIKGYALMLGRIEMRLDPDILRAATDLFNKHKDFVSANRVDVQTMIYKMTQAGALCKTCKTAGKQDLQVGHMDVVLNNVSKTLDKVGNTNALRVIQEGAIQDTKAKGCAYVFDLVGNRLDEIGEGAFERFEVIVDGEDSKHIIDIKFSDINIEVKNWKNPKSFLPPDAKGSPYPQFKGYLSEGVDFVYYFNKNGDVSVAEKMRTRLNTVFKDKKLMKELYNLNPDLFKSISGVTKWQDVRDLAKLDNRPPKLEEFLSRLIKE